MNRHFIGKRMIVHSDLYIQGARGCPRALLFVSDGISRGQNWGTFYRKQNGSMKRLKRKGLPMRKHRFEAVNDLDAYATDRGWPITREASLPQKPSQKGNQ